jgi:hypothetical protein
MCGPFKKEIFYAKEAVAIYVHNPQGPHGVLQLRPQIPSNIRCRVAEVDLAISASRERTWAVNFLRVIEKAYWFGWARWSPRSGAMLDEGSQTDAVLRGERRSLTLCKPLKRDSARFR